MKISYSSFLISPEKNSSSVLQSFSIPICISTVFLIDWNLISNNSIHSLLHFYISITSFLGQFNFFLRFFLCWIYFDEKWVSDACPSSPMFLYITEVNFSNPSILSVLLDYNKKLFSGVRSFLFSELLLDLILFY